MGDIDWTGTEAHDKLQTMDEEDLALVITQALRAMFDNMPEEVRSEKPKAVGLLASALVGMPHDASMPMAVRIGSEMLHTAFRQRLCEQFGKFLDMHV